MEWNGRCIVFPDGAYASSYRTVAKPPAAQTTPSAHSTLASTAGTGSHYAVTAPPPHFTDPRPPPPPPLCANHHACAWILGPNRAQCGKCYVRLMTPGPRWRCDGCGWDLCLVCVSASGDPAKLAARAAELPPPSPSSALRQYANAPTDAPPHSHSVHSVYANVTPPRSVPRTHTSDGAANTSQYLYGPDHADDIDRDPRIAITMAVVQPASAAAVYGNVETEPRPASLVMTSATSQSTSANSKLTSANSQSAVDAKPPPAAAKSPAQALALLGPLPHLKPEESLVRAQSHLHVFLLRN